MEKVVRSEYLHQQQMFFYNIATQDAQEKLQNTRTEIRKAEEHLEACNEEIRKASIELRDKTQARDSITQELKEIRAELLQETDLHSFIETACAQPAPSKNKDESIRILQARNGLLQQQMGKMQEDTKEVITRTQTAEAKARDAESKCKDMEARLREAEQLNDKLRIMYPDIYIELANTSKPHTKGRRKDKTA